MNKIPETRNGVITISEAGFPENELKKIVPETEPSIKSTPPANSHFHAIIKKAANIITGILCSRNPNIFMPKDTSPPNASNENMVINTSEMIVRILGVQYKNFAIYFRF